MIKKTCTAIFLLVMIYCNPIFSQESDLNAIQTVVSFLTIAPDSRAGAMGDAGVATSPDGASMHWNPAKFAFINSKYGVALSYTPWLRSLVPDINIANLTGYYKIDDKQTVSGGLIYSSLGDIDFTNIQGSFERTYRPNEWAVDVGYSRLLSDYFSGGIAFRFIYSNLTGGYSSSGNDTKPGLSVAADISAYYTRDIKAGNLSFGINLSNIGSKMNYSDSENAEFIPMNMRIGTAYTYNINSYNKISVAFDINKLLVPTPPTYSPTNNDSIVAGKNPDVSVPVAIFQSFFDAPGGFKEELQELTYSLGVEYLYNNMFAVRSGFFYESPNKGNRRYMTAGAGLKLKNFDIDFSYLIPVGTTNSPLANTIRFTLSFDSSIFKTKSDSDV